MRTCTYPLRVLADGSSRSTSSTALRTRHIAQRRAPNCVSVFEHAEMLSSVAELFAPHFSNSWANLARSARRRRMLSRLVRRRRSSICSVISRLAALASGTHCDWYSVMVASALHRDVSAPRCALQGQLACCFIRLFTSRISKLPVRPGTVRVSGDFTPWLVSAAGVRRFPHHFCRILKYCDAGTLEARTLHVTLRFLFSRNRETTNPGRFHEQHPAAA